MNVLEFTIDVLYFTSKCVTNDGSFAAHFQIKLCTHSLIINSTFVIVSELRFFLLKGVLTQNFNIGDLVKFLEKKSKAWHLDLCGHIEGDIMQNHEK